MIIFIFLVLIFYFRRFLKNNRNKKVFKDKNFITFRKSNLINWMNLTKKERYDLSKKESFSYLSRRKVLLDEIRKEYKKISKGNSDKK